MRESFSDLVICFLASINQQLTKAIENNLRPVADIEEGHISTASCILANVSMKIGRPIVYDPVKRQIANDPEANALLQRPYRQPWMHPDPDKI